MVGFQSNGLDEVLLTLKKFYAALAAASSHNWLEYCHAKMLYCRFNKRCFLFDKIRNIVPEVYINTKAISINVCPLHIHTVPTEKLGQLLAG